MAFKIRLIKQQKDRLKHSVVCNRQWKRTVGERWNAKYQSYQSLSFAQVTSLLRICPEVIILKEDSCGINGDVHCSVVYYAAKLQTTQTPSERTTKTVMGCLVRWVASRKGMAINAPHRQEAAPLFLSMWLHQIKDT